MNLNITDERDPKIPEFLFVANFAPWHGLDVLLAEIKKSSTDLKLHLVGVIPEYCALQINEMRDRRIIIHGVLNSNEIKNLSQRCWVGFSTFAHHRAGMSQSSALKVREYLHFGLPVYSDSSDVFPEDFEFYKVGETDIVKIIDYAIAMRACSKVAISEASRRYIDKTILLKNLSDWLAEIGGYKNPRVLHSAALLRPPSGICTQMVWEQEAANRLNIDWKVRMYCPKNSPGYSKIFRLAESVDTKNLKTKLGKIVAWLTLRISYHRWLLAQQDQVDVFFLRYYVHDPFQYWFIKRCKKPVYFIHHTIEVTELALPGGLSGWLRSNLERIIGKKAISNAAGVIGVTQEIVNYELNRTSSRRTSTFVYPNGILI